MSRLFGSGPVSSTSRLVFIGAAAAVSVGAVALSYVLYNKRKEQSKLKQLTGASKKKRVSSGSGENRVTFSEKDEILGESESVGVIESSKSPSPLPMSRSVPVDNPQPLTTPTVVWSPSTSATPVPYPPPPPSPHRNETTNGDASTTPLVALASLSSTVGMSTSDGVTSSSHKDKDALEKDDSGIVSPTGDEVFAATTNNAAAGVSVEPAPIVVQNTTALGQHPGHSAVTPETDFDRSSITKEVKIHRDWIPGFIGKKGCNIKSIQAKSNTQINFIEEASVTGDRICQIRGLPPDVTVAEALIQRYISDLPVVMTQSLQVPQSAVGRIIGKGGESIRSIQELSKCKVNVDTANRYGRGGSGGDIRLVTVTLKGTDDQISYAKCLIVEKVEEEKVLRRNIEVATKNRSTRAPAAPGSPPPAFDNPPLPSATANGVYSTSISIAALKDKVKEVFVCCAYHPNDFWIQVVGRESIELDKLSDMMTEFYRGSPPEDQIFNVNDIVAAPFDYDSKMYRGKVLKVDEDTMEIAYVDYGDKRVVRQSDVRTMSPDFLFLKFQAIQATLNLRCLDERWSDDAIATFCDLTYCAQWKALTAKVLDFLKPTDDSKDLVLWLELVDRDINIRDQLLQRGYAVPNESLLEMSDGVGVENGGNSNYNNPHKSYASVVASQDNVNDIPSEL